MSQHSRQKFKANPLPSDILPNPGPIPVPTKKTHVSRPKVVIPRTPHPTAPSRLPNLSSPTHYDSQSSQSTAVSPTYAPQYPPVTHNRPNRKRASSDTEAMALLSNGMDAISPMQVLSAGTVVNPPMYQYTKVVEQPISRPTPTRSGSLNKVHFTPDHIFVTFSSPNALIIHNLLNPTLFEQVSSPGPTNPTVEAIKREVITQCWPWGPVSQIENRGEWIVEFGGVPVQPQSRKRRSVESEKYQIYEEEGNLWGLVGEDGLRVRRMIKQLFQVLSRQGYSYLCSIQSATPNPRHLFTSRQPSPHIQFFILSLSASMRQMLLIDAPPHIVSEMCKLARNSAPWEVQEHLIQRPVPGVSNDSVYGFDLKRTGKPQTISSRSEDSEIVMFISQFLKAVIPLNFQLDATIPIGEELEHQPKPNWFARLFCGAVQPEPKTKQQEIWIFRSIG